MIKLKLLNLLIPMFEALTWASLESVTSVLGSRHANALAKSIFFNSKRSERLPNWQQLGMRVKRRHGYKNRGDGYFSAVLLQTVSCSSKLHYKTVRMLWTMELNQHAVCDESVVLITTSARCLSVGRTT